ncbi:unnamed protein product [Rotaria socialis]|uniref:Uncharacterized protein n=2 Tax=Rotaria socialis TaxID=392032 RepID=A0A817SJK6_9BILA|nr:unnamed protein product [Rotaria socialis]CAF3331328.1 unnamed protein product [Rotaria socialis]CAF4217124.1 unnamed protein product [Rotaria socialis]CAF4281972.1 unnamed protein product [Rotaria socialis]CAF4485214.1 unnamed protein product [Rotaria socialis]
MPAATNADASFLLHRFFREYRTSVFIVGSTVVAAWLFNKLWINHRFYPSKQSMHNKTVLITGGTIGIGYETAKDLLQRGARVIIACRNLNKGRNATSRLLSETDANEDSIRLMECDLCSLESVRNFARLYNEQEERLDILICNARLSWSSPIITKDGFNAVIQANYLGHFLLTNLLLNKMKKCRPSRILHVSSELHAGIESIDWSDVFTQFRNPHWHGAYPTSKLFQILSALKLKQDLYAERIDVFALTPGWMPTSIDGRSVKAIIWLAFILSYPFVRYLKFLFTKTPEIGAHTIVYCAVEPTLEQSNHFYFQNCTVAQPSSLAIDQIVAERLWKTSLEAVGL